MIRFKSKKVPEIYEAWLAENQQAIQEWIASDRTGNVIWKQLGKTFNVERENVIDPKDFKDEVQKAFLAEQYGLCCYCGDKIGTHYSIEHWQPKGVFKERTFDYHNLFLSCKESGRLQKYTLGGKHVQTVAELSTRVNLSEYIIRQYNKGKKETEGTIWKVPAPPHCDDNKSKYDPAEKSAQKAIIYLPDATTYNSFINYTEDGRIEIIGEPSEVERQLIDNTIEVLALDCETLRDRRKAVWEDAIFTWWDLQEYDEFLMEDVEYMRATLHSLKENSLSDNEEGELDAFFFVAVAAYESLENGY